MLAQETKHIVFACDVNYASYLITTIKSICYHHNNVQFYLINKDIPSEYFCGLNKKLALFNSSIKDIKIDDYFLINDTATHHYLTKSTYYKMLVPQLLTDLDKVLYLDTDVIVDGHLDDLFATNIDDHLLAAVKDVALNYGIHYYTQFPPDMKPYFNAGVILFNLKNYRQTDLVNQSIALQPYNFIYDDQDILNVLARNQWLVLDDKYNYQTSWQKGLEARIYAFKTQHNIDLNVDIEQICQTLPKQPTIIHYINITKPWLINNVDFRDRYWFYHDLEWLEIIQNHHA